MESLHPADICGAELSRCLCGLAPHGDDQPHECGLGSVLTDDGVCKGSWREDGTILRWPTGDTDEETARATLGRLRADKVIAQLASGADDVIIPFPLRVPRGGIKFNVPEAK